MAIWLFWKMAESDTMSKLEEMCFYSDKVVAYTSSLGAFLQGKIVTSFRTMHIEKLYEEATRKVTLIVIAPLD